MLLGKSIQLFQIASLLIGEEEYHTLEVKMLVTKENIIKQTIGPKMMSQQLHILHGILGQFNLIVAQRHMHLFLQQVQLLLKVEPINNLILL